MTALILKLFRPRSKPLHAMRDAIAIREEQPTPVRRAWCEDCEAVVVLVQSGACPCGSYSVAVVSRAWVAPPKKDRVAA